ncbi:hypothetical protein QL285_041407 [Trifolium repens]|nr:hypothetical protein QL285_041407 [Trifolium repens]
MNQKSCIVSKNSVKYPFKSQFQHNSCFLMLIVAVVVVVAKNDNSLKANADLFSEDEAKQLFTNWCDEVGRIHYTKEEYSLRFNCFRETLEWVTHQKNKGFPCCLTSFAPMRKGFLFLIAVLNLNTTLMKATFQSVVLINPSLVRRHWTWTTHRTPSTKTSAEFDDQTSGSI